MYMLVHVCVVSIVIITKVRLILDLNIFDNFNCMYNVISCTCN